jgi:hypothetical protein
VPAAKQFSLPNCMAAANQFSLLNRVVDCESVLLPTSIIGLPSRNDSNACDNFIV